MDSHINCGRKNNSNLNSHRKIDGLRLKEDEGEGSKGGKNERGKGGSEKEKGKGERRGREEGREWRR